MYLYSLWGTESKRLIGRRGARLMPRGSCLRSSGCGSGNNGRYFLSLPLGLEPSRRNCNCYTGMPPYSKSFIHVTSLVLAFFLHGTVDTRFPYGSIKTLIFLPFRIESKFNEKLGEKMYLHFLSTSRKGFPG